MANMDHRLLLEGSETIDHEREVLIEEIAKLERLAAIEVEFIKDLDLGVERNKLTIDERHRQEREMNGRERESKESSMIKKNYRRDVCDRWKVIFIIIMLILIVTITGGWWDRLRRNTPIFMREPMDSFNKLIS